MVRTYSRWLSGKLSCRSSRIAVGHTLKGSVEMLRNALVRPGEPPRPSIEGPENGSPAQARTATTLGNATRDDPMPGSSDNHLRQTATETDVIEQDIVMDSGVARTSENIVMGSEMQEQVMAEQTKEC